MATFHPNLSKVNYRVLDGEAVLIHADSQRYYALDRSGTLVWLVLLEGATGVDEVSARAADLVGAEVSELRADIDSLLEALREEDLLAENPLEKYVPVDEDLVLATWEAPRLERYDELQRLIVCGE